MSGSWDHLEAYRTVEGLKMKTGARSEHVCEDCMKRNCQSYLAGLIITDLNRLGKSYIQIFEAQCLRDLLGVLITMCRS